jgi:uncharacterized membrane protein YphA (DoxX/SURF4 family)
VRTLVAVVEFVGGRVLGLGVCPELAAALFGFQMLVGSIWKFEIVGGGRRRDSPDCTRAAG